MEATMKQFIIMSAMILLGIFIFNLIAGDGDDSLLSAIERFFRHEIKTRAGTY